VQKFARYRNTRFVLGVIERNDIQLTNPILSLMNYAVVAVSEFTPEAPNSGGPPNNGTRDRKEH